MARGLQWQTINLSMAGGLDTKGDVRAADSRQLDIARDVKFSENGGVQTRLPFGAPLSDIFGGGTIADARRIEAYSDELVLFTDDALYSWNAQLSKWVRRGTHLAVSVDETPRFATTGDQIDGERAELDGTVVVAWVEGAQVFAAALDKTTSSVLVSPTAVSTAIGRPRLVALATKILLFVEATTTLLTVRAIDPATPATGIGGVGTTVLATDFNLFYDVVRAGTQDLAVGACRRVTTTSYTAFTVTPALLVTTSTKARTCDGPIAVATIGDGTQTQVVRGNGTNVQGDLLTTSTLADVFSGQAIGTATGTPINQIAAAFRSVQDGGAFRCYVFWSAEESSSNSSWVSKSNFVDTAGAIGTQANFVRHLGVASRAFDHDGSVYLWLTFAGATTFNGSSSFPIPSVSLQNTYFLYRDDAFLSNAKAVATHGGGFAPSTGRLPGVALTSGSTIYSWCATERRRILLESAGQGFAARALVDVVFEFDSDTARRTALIGRTMYIVGGEVVTYDSARLVECGFHVYPWIISLIDAGGGSMAVGPYGYKETYRYQNGQNETERSTTATVGTVIVTGSSVSLVADNAPLTATHKTEVPPAVEVWRSAVAPSPEAPFYLASSNDPAALTNPNRYIPNDPTAASLPTFNDFLADASLTIRETNPENGAVLESLAPPGASIIFATDTRIFLGGIAGDPDSVAYTRLRGVGEIASFHDGNVFPVPAAGGRMTAIATINETLVVFRESAIYAFPGQGFDNLGQGFNFGPPTQISSDCGAVSAESVALTPMGLIFKSRKGWYLATLGGVRYIGAAVADFDADTVHAVHVMATEHEVRILTDQRLLAWDYQAVTESAPQGQWAERTIDDGVHAAIWRGSYVYLTPAGPRIEATTYAGADFGIDVETAWVKNTPDLQGAVRVREFLVLGEYRSDFLLRLRVARDYLYDANGDPLYYDDVVWSPPPGSIVGSALQVGHMPSQGACEAIKVRLTAVAAGVRATLATATDLSAPVQTTDTLGPGPAWAATFRCFSAADALAAGKTALLGEHGNLLTMSLSFELGAAALVDVRDHFLFDPATGRWREAINNVGVRVVSVSGGVGDPETIGVGVLATSIGDGTKLMQVQLTDPANAVVAMANMDGQLVTGTFSGGTFVAPSGEACKLTGLALEVGLKPGIHRRLTADKKA